MESKKDLELLLNLATDEYNHYIKQLNSSTANLLIEYEYADMKITREYVENTIIRKLESYISRLKMKLSRIS